MAFNPMNVKSIKIYIAALSISVPGVLDEEVELGEGAGHEVLVEAEDQVHGPPHLDLAHANRAEALNI